MPVTATVPFNNISEKLKSRIKPLRPGQVAQYQVIGPVPNVLRVPSEVTIFDPGGGTDGQGDYVKIANAKDSGSNGRPNVTEVKFMGATGGVLQVDATQQSLYRFLEMHPNNADSVLPQGKWEPLFTRIKPEKDARDKVAFMADVLAAGQIINLASPEDLQFFGREFGLDTTPDIDDQDQPDYSRLRAALFDVAAQQPTEVMGRNRSEVMKAYALVRELAAQQIIRFDEGAGEWEIVATAETLCPVASDVEREDGLVQWLTRTADGRKRQAQFREQLLKLHEAKNRKK